MEKLNTAQIRTAMPHP